MEKPPELQYIHDIINSKLTEDKYFQDRADGIGRLIYDLPEIEYLKQEPSLFRTFLLHLSYEGRLRILLTKEILGMPQSILYPKYGIPQDVLSTLKGQKKSNKKESTVKIRKISKVGQPKFEYITTLSIFTKIPFSWLHEDYPIQLSWDVSHFDFIPEAAFDIESFKNYIESTEKIALQEETVSKHTRPDFAFVFDIRGIILHIDSRKIYLRISFWEGGGFVVELFGERDQLNDYILIKKLLEPFGPLKVGYCKTVIDNQINMMIIARSQANEFIYPVEFKRF